MQRLLLLDAAPQLPTASAAAAALCLRCLAAVGAPGYRQYAQAAFDDAHEGRSEAAPSSGPHTTSTTSAGSSSRSAVADAGGIVALLHTQQLRQQQQQWVQALRTDNVPGDRLREWQRLARLSPEAAAALLQEQPLLRSWLGAGSGLRQHNQLINLACLSLDASELQGDQHAPLRGLLALMPPAALQQWLAEHNLLQRPLTRPQLVQQLQECLLKSLGPLRVRAPQAGVHHSLGGGDAQQQQQHHHHHHHHHLGPQPQQQLGASGHGQRAFPGRHQQQQGLQGLAEAVVQAIGLGPHDPLDRSYLPLPLRRELADRSTSTTSSSSSSSMQLGSSGGSSSSSSSSASRTFATSSSADLTVSAGLARVLERTSRSVSLRAKPLHDAGVAAAMAMQLRDAVGLDPEGVLRLLLRRPVLLWRHMTPLPPAALLSQLQQLLPPLAEGQQLLRLVQRAPGLLSCSAEQLDEAAQLLLGRLQLSLGEVAALVLACPQLLLTPPRQMSANVGFLVGLGLQRPALHAMALREPQWLALPLRDLTVQWHFTQQVLKLGLEDLVLFPRLLTLPIGSRLGPRALYARKRSVKLVAPRYVDLLASSSSGGDRGSRSRSSSGGGGNGLAAARQAWRQHGHVSLEFWMSASEKHMCAAVGLDLEDFKRFKSAWGRVDGVNWSRLCLDGRSGGGKQQLQLSSQDIKW